MKTNQSNKTVAVSIVTWNSAEEIGECLDSLKDLPPNWQVWVVDNDSSDKTVEIIKRDFPEVNLVVNPENIGFAAANNQVIVTTKTDYVLLLNPDTISETAELEKLLEIAKKILKSELLAENFTMETAILKSFANIFRIRGEILSMQLGCIGFFRRNGGSDKLLGEFFDYESEGKVQWFVGAFMLAKREAIEKAGLVPEDYFMFAEAMHWCYLMWQNGYQVWYTNRVKIIHKMNRSAGQLPQAWRVEKSTLCKYVFCYGEFGWLKTKFIELTDFMSYTLGIWRLMFRKPEPLESKSWKMSRKVIWQALKMGKKETAKKQLEKFTPIIVSFMTTVCSL